MDSLSDTLQKLKLMTSEGDGEKITLDTEDILATLSQMVESLTKENDGNVTTESMVENNVGDTLAVLLSPESTFESLRTKEKAAEIVAELAKTDNGRQHCSNARIISSLVELLICENLDVSTQACRALGNICYDNDYGRSIVHEQQGTDKLLQFLKSASIASEGREPLRTVATGFLLNLINTYELTQQRILEKDVLNTLCDYLSKYGQEDDVCIHALLVLNCLADYDNGREKIIEKNICGNLVALMDVEVSSEVVEAVLELIGNLAENDIVKYQLATTTLCDKLLKFLKACNTTQNDESLNVTKVATDLIVLILTGDESMKHLYQNGQGSVYREILTWLSSKDETLKTSAVLAIGNFARKDLHCIQMVSEGIINQLLDLLKQHNNMDGDIRLQHALLSALRNLAIPGVNKRILLDMGVIETIIPMLAVDTFPVVFKLLGTLRMLVDKQEDAATKLGSNRDFVSRLLEWCKTKDHPGVTGEATRLLAWLIKNSKSVEVMKIIVELGGLPFLGSMTTSEHEVMQNEGLIALCLICTTDLEMVEESLLNSELSSYLRKLLLEETIHAEVKCNVLTLVTVLSKSDKLKEDLAKAEIPDMVAKFSDAENEVLSEAANAIKQLFESG